MKKILALLVLLITLTSSLTPTANALSVLQLNLEQMTALADQIFYGRCDSVNKTVNAQGQHIQTVTYSVIEMLKGQTKNQVVFTQLVGGEESSLMVGNQKTDILVRDLPEYRVGEEAVIFLSAPGVAGLTAPLGLLQGKFDVSTVRGEKTAQNALKNRGLFLKKDGAPALKSLRLNAKEQSLLEVKQGPLSLNSFNSLVRKINAQQD